MFFLGAPRLGYRAWKDRSLNLKAISSSHRVIIIGAGRAAEMLIREMNRDGQYAPVGLLDDNEQLINSEIHGVKVLGKIEQIYEVFDKFGVNSIIIAIPSTIEGDATSYYLKDLLKDYPIKITRPARGLPMGMNIEYVDEFTLQNSIEQRIEMDE